MPYKPNIPLPTDAIRISQNDLLVNFQQISAVFQNNHANFNSATPGTHTGVQFVAQAAAPATLANQFGLYAFLSPLTAQIELFTKRAANGTTFGITEANFAQPGYARTSSGVLMQWGLINSAPGAATFNLPQPYVTAFLGIQFTMRGAGGDPNTFVELSAGLAPGNPTVVNIFSGQRTGNNVPAASTFYYLAYGI